jgi:hypothetical protein
MGVQFAGVKEHEMPKKKKIFNPEDIKDEVEDYVFNQDPPYDELDEIGGSHMTMTDISDIEIIHQRESGDNFIVDGQGTLELTRDMGEGDSSDEAYPITFSFEFDADGKIVKQLRRHVDTSSFFAVSEDIYGDLLGVIGTTTQSEVFNESIRDIQNHLHQPDSTAPFLHKLLYVHVVTALESYLSDFLISRVLKDRAMLRQFIEQAPVFQEQTLTVNQIFDVRATIKKRAINQLEKTVWHRLDHVGGLYSKVLSIDFPSDLNNVKKAIKLRNLLVHRNGKTIGGKQQKVTEKDIVEAIGAVEVLVNHIEEQWRLLQPRPEPEPNLPDDIEI